MNSKNNFNINDVYRILIIGIILSIIFQFISGRLRQQEINKKQETVKTLQLENEKLEKEINTLKERN